MDLAEDLALVLTNHGLQRMTARVLAALLFTQQESVTAGELAERLRASAGSVSGAITMLSRAGLAERVPAPGSRRDHYRCPDDAWIQLLSAQNEVLRLLLSAAERGVTAVGAESVAGRRLENMRGFYAHLLAELPAVVRRWRERS